MRHGSTFRSLIRARSALTTLFAVVLVAGLGTTPAAAAPVWSITPMPSPVAPASGALRSVACATSTMCFSVGTNYPLVQSWDGSSWSVVILPVPAGAFVTSLDGIACPDATDCFAVGSWQSGTGPSDVGRTLVEHWDGSAWSIQTSVDPGPNFSSLHGVECLSNTTCFAVGQYQSGNAIKSLIEHWNGTAWSLVSSPNPAGAVSAVLASVACANVTTCMAVGSWQGSANTPSPFAARWNGSTWVITAVVKPAGKNVVGFSGVSCPGPLNCIAVGFAENSSATGRPTSTLVEKWNGTWSIVASPNVAGARSSVLAGMTCTAATNCVAVGFSSVIVGGNSPAGDAKTLIERWNGTSWTIEASPNPADGPGTLDAVACADTVTCFAVASGALTEKSNGTTWTIEPPAAGGSQAQLHAATCQTATNCFAVGYNSTNSGIQPTAEQWDGTNWAITPTPKPVGAQDTRLNGVACATATACFAVGATIGSTLQPARFAERWNGAAWVIVTLPNPAGGHSSTLTGVTCPSATSCFAVGWYSVTVGSQIINKTLVEHWNGTGWAVVASPSQAGARETDLAGVTCVSTTNCFAAGTYNTSSASKTFIIHMTGTTWAEVASPTPTTVGNSATLLEGVSCLSATSCFAVGSYFPMSNKQLALIERWNGTTWVVAASPTPAGANVFHAISCAKATTTCFAVGTNASALGGVNSKTLIEKWSGAGWSTVASPNQPDATVDWLYGVSCVNATNCRAVGSFSARGNLFAFSEQYS